MGAFKVGLGESPAYLLYRDSRLSVGLGGAGGMARGPGGGTWLAGVAWDGVDVGAGVVSVSIT